MSEAAERLRPYLSLELRHEPYRDSFLLTVSDFTDRKVPIGLTRGGLEDLVTMIREQLDGPPLPATRGSIVLASDPRPFCRMVRITEDDMGQMEWRCLVKGHSHHVSSQFIRTHGFTIEYAAPEEAS